MQILAASAHFGQHTRPAMRLVLHILVVGLLIVPVSAQKKRSTPDEVFVTVPAQLRQRLIERLNLLVTYQSKRDWDKVYELLTDRYRGDDTRQKFVAQQKHAAHLSKFSPDATTDSYHSESDGEWSIWGCGEYGSWPGDKYIVRWFKRTVKTATGTSLQLTSFSNASTAKPSRVINRWRITTRRTGAAGACLVP
jgi:hypothetical protein